MRKYSKNICIKCIKAGWQLSPTLSDKFSLDSHSFNDISTMDPRIPTRVPHWQLKKSRKTHDPPCKCANPLSLPSPLKLQPPLQTWFLAAKQPSHNPVEMRGLGGGWEKKSRQRIAWKRMVERWSTSDAPRDELVIQETIGFTIEPSNVSIPTPISIERKRRKERGKKREL